jgi:hypothetical protein
MLALLRSVITKEPAPPPGADWAGIAAEAAAHRVAPVVYRAALTLPPGAMPAPELLAAWKQDVMAAGMRQMRKELCLAQINKAMAAAGVKAILLKGVVLARLYPSTVDREMVDADILVPGGEMERAAGALTGLGYTFSDQLSGDNEDTYINGILNVELHARPWEESSGERFEKLDSVGAGVFADAVRVEEGGDRYWTLRPQDMVFYLVYHMVKHFFVCGIGARYLSDMALYVNRYHAEINWEKFWRDIGLLGYGTFTKSFFYLCEAYLGMDTAGIEMPGLSPGEIAAAEAMLADMAEGGHSGARTMVRYKAGRVLRIYYENENTKMPRSRLEMLRRVFFPSRGELNNMKTVRGEKPKNLASAWFWHIGFLFDRWRGRKQERCPMRERLGCAQKRLDMLHGLGLVKGKP